MLFDFYINILFSIIFFFGGALVFYRYKANKIAFLICLLIISSSLLNLFKSINSYPSLKVAKVYIELFNKMESSDINKMFIETEYINYNFVEEKFEISKTIIEKVVNTLKKGNIVSYIELNDWTPKNVYDMRITTSTNKYELKIFETDDSRTFIHLFYDKGGIKKSIITYQNSYFLDLDLLKKQN